MKVEDAILKRRSVRSYKDKNISPDKLEKIMNAVRMAPSANNRQDWKFIVVKDEKKKNEVFEASKEQSQIKEAPVVIAGIATDSEKQMTCEVPGGIVDVTIALDHLSLIATEEGLGTCWIGAFYQDKVKKALEVPEEHKVVSMMTLGYPKKSMEKREKNRKELSEVVSYNVF
ncbi:nitroreductase [candidate division MSBL1 archaeon SCGC-AAA382K21]|uniref:Nitroreductase n=1 Tax=candidate division MSBL1 archaeon SCGC-AAA382K21 TaxID=1698283 RepID=A0A133VKI3_9EURY|nr:nitroreductase [candidate division MSBL1 archaeon SCGC-AAA382K21]